MSDQRFESGIVRSYSRHAGDYEAERNQRSCWAPVTDEALASLRVEPRYERIVDVGCGAGHALEKLASATGQRVELVGVEPAEELRKRAVARLQRLEHVRVIDGRFEELPLETDSVDYLVSILAFHWTTDPELSVSELARVLRPDGDMNLSFVGRNTGQEFTRKTTPVFLKYMGPIALLKSASMRNHLTGDSTRELFARHFPEHRLSVTESMETYYDDLDGHWSWWVARASGHFESIPDEQRAECDDEVRKAISSLQTDRGIPYTVHRLRVQVSG